MFGRWGGEIRLWARGERTGPASSSKPAPDPRVEAGLSQPQVALHSLGCACMGVVCVVPSGGRRVEDNLVLFFLGYSISEACKRDFWGGKKKSGSAMIHPFLLLIFWKICFVCACPVVIKSKPGRQTILGTV